MCSDPILTRTDGGREIPVTVGALVELRLPEVPTTGFRWTLPDGVKIRHDGYADIGATPGAAATRILRLTMPDRTLHLTLRRQQAWAPDAPDDSVSFHLVPA